MKKHHKEKKTETKEETVEIAVSELEALRQEVAESKDKYLRLLAESENTRKRMLKASASMDAFIEKGQRRLAHSLLCRFSSQLAPSRLIRPAHIRIIPAALKCLAGCGWKIGLHGDLIEGAVAEHALSKF